MAAAGSPRKLEVARELGADVVVDYEEPDWPDGCGPRSAGWTWSSTGSAAPSAGRRSSCSVAVGGCSATGSRAAEWAGISEEAAARVVCALLRSVPSPGELRAFTVHALAEAAAGRLRPLIGQRFPLERAADAHAALQSRATVGKTLLVSAPWPAGR